ncbi:MAG: AbrB family transcriptional regulator [Desulfuromonadales bacterium]
MDRVVVILVVGVVGGLLAKNFGMPGGPVVGSMFGAGLAAVIFPGHLIIPDQVSTSVQIMLGVTLGMTFDRSSLLLLGRLLPLAVLSTLALLCCAVLMAWLAQRAGTIDFATALFGFSPGGMSGMSLLAQAEGRQTDIVALLHTVRVFTLFLLVPWLSRYLLGWSRVG